MTGTTLPQVRNYAVIYAKTVCEHGIDLQALERNADYSRNVLYEKRDGTTTVVRKGVWYIDATSKYITWLALNHPDIQLQYIQIVIVKGPS